MSRPPRFCVGEMVAALPHDRPESKLINAAQLTNGRYCRRVGDEDELQRVSQNRRIK
jgi:hypothetical protein